MDMMENVGCFNGMVVGMMEMLDVLMEWLWG